VPIWRLGASLAFPDPRDAEPSGLLAVGGDLRAERLLEAYASGIFPWYEEDPILWFSPDPRLVLVPGELRVGRSLAKVLRKRPFEIRFDSAFDEVVAACAGARRPGQAGTWITAEMRRAYGELHRLGFAHSVEAWREGELAGGLYGVSLGAAFFGESMFARAADASKVAFVELVRRVLGWEFRFVDCQVETEHLRRFGATLWSRARFLDELALALRSPTRRGPWA
jgi:leucyl/phenylalanyl-tRNA--protein transferase